MKFLTIDDWVDALVSIPEREFTKPRLHAFTFGNGIRPEGLSPYLFYGSHYTRNLIYRCPLFEVVAICWDVGQVSLPHDHGGQDCWMVTPIGKLRVENFRIEDQDARSSTCRLSHTGGFEMDATHPAEVDAEEPVHQVLNPAQFNMQAVSVHVYSRPYTSCEIYHLDTGAFHRRELRYWSEFGQLCPPAVSE